ncbi:MAG: NIL domain-containing protein [bacterium]
MPKKVKKIFKLVFPQKLIKEPVVFTVAKKFNLVPNIRRAKVTKFVGELVLEVDGMEKDIEKGINYLMKNEVIVKPIEGDIID